MKNFTTTGSFAAVAVLVFFLALPAFAERPSRRDEPREPAIIRIIKAAKHVLGISTNGDYPTVPKP